MGDEPYRILSQRHDSPSHHMTVEQIVDTRLCVSSLTPKHCHLMMGQLDDRQIKNAVYDRTLCFPFDQWTQNIRLAYGQQVQHDNQVVVSFENMTNHMESLFATWRDVYFFKEGDFDNIEAHVKSYLSPSTDNIGVYGTYSDHTVTKINALEALLKIGKIIIEIPILTSKRGLAMFAYDPLSRAVGNILSTTTTDASRRRILDPSMEGEFLELTKRAATVGLFPGLLKALTSGSGAVPYNVPRGEQLMPNNNSNKRVSAGQVAPAAKRSKLSQGGQYMGQAAIDQEGAPTPGSSRASSHQPRGITEGWAAEPSGTRNPFSRPSSAGPVAMPFAKSANSTPTSNIKTEGEQIEQEQIEQEQIEPSLRALSQGAELQGIAKGATEYQTESQEIQQATKDAQGQGEQAKVSREYNKPGPETQQPATEEQQQGPAAQQSQPQQTEQAGTQEAGKPAYDDLLRRVETEVFHAHGDEPPEEQLRRAPAVVALVEGTAGTILRLFQEVAEKTDESRRRDLFLSSLNDTAFALLWVLESCALNLGGTPLAAEVSRCVSRDALVRALWGSVRLASASEWLILLDVKDHMKSETFGEKLERIIRQLDETGVAGFGALRFIVANMRSGVSLPVHNPQQQPNTSDT